MKTVSIQLLLALLILKNASFALAEDRQSYVGEYAERNIVGKNTKVDFPRCREIDSSVLVSGIGEWMILAECDIEQPKIKSIRVWRTKLEVNVGLKIYGEIILPWQKTDQYMKYPLLCTRKIDENFNVGGYIGFKEDEPSVQNGLVYFLMNNDGTISQIPSSEIDRCDRGEGGMVN